jgi:two-component system, NtrC family, response regulator PilR
VTAKVLVIDDEPNLRELLRIVLESEGYDVREAATYAEAQQVLAKERQDLVLCDIYLPDGSGLDLVRTYHPANPDTAFVVITAHTTPAHAITALRDGAVEYLSKPFDVEELRLITRKQLARRSKGPEIPPDYEVIGRSRAMWPILERLAQVAASDATVLLTGESGTGKELLARAIHRGSARVSRLFVPVNCGALPEGLLESELFGHARGSFTGAVKEKRGLIQEAHGGTLFLDEIAEMSANTQVKLLRAIQERRIRPVGDNREVDVDVRIITATNQDLQARVAEGLFREDFFYRINVIHIHVPPLRERAEDIPFLARLFVERACVRVGTPLKTLHRDAVALLESYSWPGNIRQLENVIERMVAMEQSPLLTVSSLPPALLGADGSTGHRGAPTTVLPAEGFDIEAHLDAIRRQIMQEALDRCGGVQKDAARLLRMTYRAFRYHAEKYGLTSPEE